MPPDRRPRLAVTAALAAGITLAWLAAVTQLVAFIPREKKRFDEHGVQFPGLAKAVYEVGNAIAGHEWLMLSSIACLILWGGVLTYFTRHRVRSVPVRLLGLLIALGPPVLVNGVILLTLLLLEVKYREVRGG